MENRKFKFRIGDERSHKIEINHQDESIFFEQYQRALNLISELCEAPSETSPNIVAFCGNRGEGKTSCMLSVKKILGDLTFEDNKKVIQKLNCPNLIQFCGTDRNPFCFINTIEPSFFDSNHNIVELVLGQMYLTFKKKIEKEESQFSYHKLLEKFAQVKGLLKNLYSSQDHYDKLEELEELSVALSLRSKISDLITEYLHFLGFKKLILVIDDLDLVAQGAYKMCEEIHKYFSLGNCIILMAVSISQLENSIAKEIGGFRENKEIDSELAEKYVTKLIPHGMRVPMPKLEQLYNYQFELYEGNSDIPDLGNITVKEALLRGIFQTTRYLFYNSYGRVSEITPDNLRELSELAGLVFSLPKILRNVSHDERDAHQKQLKRNQNLFKSYFFYTWTKQLKTYQEVIEGILSISDLSLLNKYVISKLKKYVVDPDKESQEIDTELKEENQLLKALTNDANFAFNVSIGDVFRILHSLEGQKSETEFRKLIFFIRSYYSVLLFDLYDQLTEGNNDVNPYDTSKSKSGIYKQDSLFRGTNDLQNFVGASYFTYYQAELIATEKDNRTRTRDLRVLSGTNNDYDVNLNEYFKNMPILANEIKTILGEKSITELSEEDSNKVNLYIAKFQLGEYLMYSILCRHSRNEVKHKQFNNIRIHYDRSKPYYMENLNANVGYYVFDVLRIFASLLNPEYCVKRFQNMDDLWITIKDNQWSLLNYMADNVSDLHNGHKMHNLLSNAVIRNGEILDSLWETVRTYRDQSQSDEKSANAIRLASFYSRIKDSNMVRYQYPDSNDEDYNISFSFLDPIINLLSDSNINVACTVGNYEFPSFESIWNFKEKEIDNEEPDKVEALADTLYVNNVFLSQEDIIKEIINNFNNESGISENSLKEVFTKTRYKKKTFIKIFNKFLAELESQNNDQQPEIGVTGKLPTGSDSSTNSPI